ncbi:hypothetical protein ON010_g2278 [Phytophthora cinnamomi]|nr:hypothetical protein ON010_g2278 [Phytophthora cinnamomi]
MNALTPAEVQLLREKAQAWVEQGLGKVLDTTYIAAILETLAPTKSANKSADKLAPTTDQRPRPGTLAWIEN